MFLIVHAGRIEALVDRMVSKAPSRTFSGSFTCQLSEIEAQRDLSQIIVHVDMDAFFAVAYHLLTLESRT